MRHEWQLAVASLSRMAAAKMIASPISYGATITAREKGHERKSGIKEWRKHWG